MSRSTPPWLRPITERLSPTIRTLVVLLALSFGFFVMAPPLREGMKAHLVLGPGMLAGELWQVVTSLFVCLDPWNFFFIMLGLWFAGATVERNLGRRRFLLLFLGSGVVANLVVGGLIALLRMPVQNPGCGDSVLAIFVALGVLYGRTPLRVWGQLALQARILAWIFVGMSVLSLLMQGAWPLLGGTIAAQVLAYFLAGGKPGRVVALFGGIRIRRRANLGVLEGGRTKGGKKYVN